MADVLTTDQLGKRRYPGFELAPPFEFLGRLVAGFFFLVYGARGSGKSTWTLGLARALVELAPLVYVSGEEDHGPTLSMRIRRMDAGHPDFHVALWTERGAAAVLEVVDRTGAKFVVVDSATRIDPSSKKVQELWAALKARNVALIAIGHATQTGLPKVGGTFLEHEVHTLVRVEKVDPDTDEAVAVTEKNRYAGLANAPVAFTADAVAEAGGYGFTAYRADGGTWFKNGGDWQSDPSVQAAMFARLEESGERLSSKSSRKRSGGRSSGGSGASAPASGAGSTKSGPTRQGIAAIEKVREGVEAGTYVRDRKKHEVVGTYTDAKDRSVLAIRDREGLLHIGTMGRIGLTWRQFQPESALDKLTPTPLDAAFPVPATADEPEPAPKKTAPKRTAKKAAAKRKTPSKTPAPSAADAQARATLDTATGALARMKELLTTGLN